MLRAQYLLVLSGLCAHFSGAQTRASVQPSAKTAPDVEVPSAISQSARNMVGRSFYLCPRSQDVSDIAIENRSRGDDFGAQKMVIRSFDLSPVDAAKAQRAISGARASKAMVPCRMTGPCYEIDFSISSGSDDGRNEVRPIAFQTSELAGVAPANLTRLIEANWAVLDHEPHLQQGASNADVQCLLGHPDTTNDYGSGGKQLIWNHRPEGSVLIVYEKTNGTLDDVHLLNQH